MAQQTKAPEAKGRKPATKAEGNGRQTKAQANGEGNGAKGKVAKAISNALLRFARKGRFAHLVTKENPTVTLCGYQVSADQVLPNAVTPKLRQALRDLELTGWGYTGELVLGFNGPCLRCDAKAEARPMAKTRGDAIAAELREAGAEPRVKPRQTKAEPKVEAKPTPKAKATPRKRTPKPKVEVPVTPAEPVVAETPAEPVVEEAAAVA